MVGYHNFIRLGQTSLRSSYIEKPKPVEPQSRPEDPKKHYVLLVGFTEPQCQSGLVQAISNNSLEFVSADNEDEALGLLRAKFKENKFCELVVLSGQVRNPYEVGALTDILRSRSMCGEVAVINPVDELRARKLGMLAVNSIQDVISYLAQKDKVNYTLRCSTSMRSDNKLNSSEQTNLDGLLVALQACKYDMTNF